MRDVVVAAANLAERAGAKSFEVGHTDPVKGPVTWHMTADYGDRQIIASGHPDPGAAALALADRLLTGAKCKCGGLVALSVAGAFAPPETATMLDGSDPVALRTAEHCLWILVGDRWESSCDAPPLTIARPGDRSS